MYFIFFSKFNGFENVRFLNYIEAKTYVLSELFFILTFGMVLLIQNQFCVSFFFDVTYYFVIQHV